MRLVEMRVVGKRDGEVLCEDLVFVGEQLVAVIDGATDKTGWRVATPRGEVTSGRFAADVLADALSGVEPGTEPLVVVSLLSAALDDAIRRSFGAVEAHERPSASIVVFDSVAGVVWRVGDCPFRIGDAVYNQPKRIDEVTADFRAAFIEASGASLSSGDPGRDAIAPLLKMQGGLANKLGEFGYGVIDGQAVPHEFVEIVPVPDGVHEIVLASDGYPTLPMTLLEAEAELAVMLEADPRCVGVLRGTKGVEEGAVSFDDRSWLRIAL